jgi:outer membrane protein TolC
MKKFLLLLFALAIVTIRGWQLYIGKRRIAIIFGAILIIQAFLPTSCVSPSPEPSSNYAIPEAKPPVPYGAGANTQQQPALQKPTDTNNAPPSEGPLRIGLREAILLAMENNQSLIVERMNPQITRTFEQEELAVFEPVLDAGASSRRAIADRLSRAGSGIESSTMDSVTGLISLSKLFPTGTTVAIEGSTGYTDSSLYSDTLTANRLGLTVTQALLQGFDVCANLARVNQARLDTLISQYELRGFTEILLEEVESKFWDYVVAQRQIEIYTSSLNLAEKQMTEIQERIKLGDLAESELAAAQAEVALRRENLINARSTFAKEHLELLHLMNPSRSIDWNRDVILEYDTALPNVNLDNVNQHVEVALRMRPDLNQARLQIQRGDLEVVKTKNGLLPKMDVFISFGKTGYADSFSKSANNIGGDSYDVAFGLVFQETPANQAAHAQHSRAVISRQQLHKALENLSQLVEVDVRSAYIEVTGAREQIAATAATRNFQEEKLRVETEKFRVGKSTSLLVGQAQRDFVTSQIAEIEALANYLKALVWLYRLEGSLLERRGIAGPGREPVKLSDMPEH